MPSLTSVGGNQSQADIENYVGSLLKRGFSQEKTKQELLRAQLPSLSQEYARSQGALDVGRREVSRPLEIEKARAMLQAEQNVAGGGSAAAQAAQIGLQYRLAQYAGKIQDPTQYRSSTDEFGPRPLQRSMTPYYGGLNIPGTNGPYSTNYGSATFTRRDYRPTLTALKSSYDTYARNLANARIAQIAASAANIKEDYRPRHIQSVLDAIENRNLLTADVTQIAKILGVSLNVPEGTKLGRG